MKKFLSLLLILALTLTMFGGVAMAADECPEGGKHDWKVQRGTEPTCTESGFIYYKCSKCRYTKRVDYQPLGHIYAGSWKPLTDRPSYEMGTCARCGNIWIRPIEGYKEPQEDADEVVMAITKSVEGLEEGQPLVLGRTYKFLIHVSNLQNREIYMVLVSDEMAVK